MTGIEKLRGVAQETIPTPRVCIPSLWVARAYVQHEQRMARNAKLFGVERHRILLLDWLADRMGALWGWG